MEPISESDDTTRIFVESQDSDSENSLCEESGNSRKEAFLRSPSFVKYNQIRPVTPVLGQRRILNDAFAGSNMSLNEAGVSAIRPAPRNTTRLSIQGFDLVPPPSGNGRSSRASNVSATSSIIVFAPDARPSDMDVGYVGSPQPMSDSETESVDVSSTRHGKKLKSKKRRLRGCKIS